MAAPAAAAHRSGSGGGSVRWLALTIILVLAAGAVVLHRSRRPLRAHRFARDFYANIKSDVRALWSSDLSDICTCIASYSPSCLCWQRELRCCTDPGAPLRAHHFA